MGNLNDTLASLEKSLPSTPTIDDAFITKVSSQANSLMGHVGDLKEKQISYITNQIPNDPLPTPSVGSPLPDTNAIKEADFAIKQVAVEADQAKAASVVTKYVQTINNIKDKIQEKLTSGLAAISNAKSVTLSDLNSEENKLFGTDAAKRLEEAKVKVQQEAARKTELIKTDLQ